MNKSFERRFYGSTTIGEKGQVVIPAEARAKMRIKKGDKLLVFGMGPEMLMLMKFSQFEKFATHMSKNLARIKKVINKKQG